MSQVVRSRRRFGWRAAISMVVSVSALVTVLAMPAQATSVPSADATSAAVFPGAGSSTTTAWVRHLLPCPNVAHQ